MDRIVNSLKENSEMFMYGGIVSLVGYIVLRPYIWRSEKVIKISRPLEASLQFLYTRERVRSIRKVVVTINEQNDRIKEFRSVIIDSIKEVLKKKQITTLINCSPQKLLMESCEYFLESDYKQDSEWLDYYQNALRMQLLIEDTIASIEMLNPHEEGKDIVMICDNNLLDVKLTANPSLWHRLLDKTGITEEKLKDFYDIVINITSNQNDGNDGKIAAIWNGFPEYHEYYYDSTLTMEENRDRTVSILSQYLHI